MQIRQRSAINSMRYKIRFIKAACTFLTLIFLGINTVTAQEACETIVQTAIETAAENCDGLRGGQACYGNVVIDAEAVPGVDDFTFESEGDLVSVSDLASLRLSSQVDAGGQWGISLMRVPVALGDETVDTSLVLFGDVEVIAGEADVESIETPEPEIVTVELTTTGNLNVRGGPSTSDAVVGGLTAGQTVTADARNTAGDWARITLDDGTVGWVFVPLMTTDDDPTTLAVASGAAPTTDTVSPDDINFDPVFGPMQVFTLITPNGAGDRPCASAPDSGLLIQTPEGAGQISFLINEVIVEVGSTALVRMLTPSLMRISNLEGAVTAISNNVPVVLAVGEGVDVQLGSAPSPPTTYAYSDVRSLPLVLLPDRPRLLPSSGIFYNLVFCMFYPGRDSLWAGVDTFFDEQDIESKAAGGPIFISQGFGTQVQEEAQYTADNGTFSVQINGQPGSEFGGRVWDGDFLRETGFWPYDNNWYYVIPELGPGEYEITGTIFVPAGGPLEQEIRTEPLTCTMTLE